MKTRFIQIFLLSALLLTIARQVDVDAAPELGLVSPLPQPRSIRKLKRAVAPPLAEGLIHRLQEVGGVGRVFGHYGVA